MLESLWGVSDRTVQRKMVGASPITVSELERVAKTVNVAARTIAESALSQYGEGSIDDGVNRLMSEARGISDDLEKKRLQKELAARTPAEIDEHRERKDTPSAAQRRDAETEADESDPS